MNRTNRVIQEISIDQVRRSERNIRGQNIGNTTDLQATMRRRIHDGRRPLIYPLLVRTDPEDPELYIVMEGNRRFTALSIIGYPTVDCIVDDNATDDEERRIGMLSDVRKALPLLVLRNGRVAAGKALAIYEEVMAGAKRIEVAEEFGLDTDAVGAMVRLCEPDIPTEVLERVEEGTMALTVFSRIKRQPISTMLSIVRQKNGQITRSWVDAFIKKNRETNLLPDSEPERTVVGVDWAEEGGDQSVTAVVSLDDFGKRVVARYLGEDADGVTPVLNDIKLKLETMQGVEFSDADWFILEQIEDLLFNLTGDSQ